ASPAPGSAGVIGGPNHGGSAASATVRPSATAAAKASLSCVDMTHLALGIDAPACDGVAVLHGECGHIRGTPGRTAFGDECLARRLHVARLVCRPALQDHPPPIPAPR